MKVQIRQGVFETNSSSTHSLSIFAKEDWEDFKKGKKVMSDYPNNPKLVDIDSVNPEYIYNYETDEEEYDDIYLYSFKYEDYDDVGCFENILKETDNKIIMSTYGEWY